MSERIYLVTTSAYEFFRKDHSIESARLWARSAFPKQAVTVQNLARTCDHCDCAPCVCMIKATH